MLTIKDLAKELLDNSELSFNFKDNILENYIKAKDGLMIKYTTMIDDGKFSVYVYSERPNTMLEADIIELNNEYSFFKFREIKDNSVFMAFQTPIEFVSEPTILLFIISTATRVLEDIYETHDVAF